MSPPEFGPRREAVPDCERLALRSAFSQITGPLYSESMIRRDGFFWMSGSDLLAKHDPRIPRTET